MIPFRSLAVLLAMGLSSLALLFVASAASASVTLGSPLQELELISQCSAQPCALVQTALPQSGAAVVSPVSGVVLEWRMLGGSSSFPYRLRVLTPGPEGSYTATGSSQPSFPSGPGLQRFLTAIPIRAGQVVAIELQAGAPLAYAPTPGASFNRLAAPLSNGVPGVAIPGSSFELGFNAEIAVAPTPPAALPASPVAPAQATTTTSGACTVPSLVGAKLMSAKRRIRKGGCRVGNVTKRNGATAKTGRVVKQNPKAGKVLAPGAKVHVKLGL
jgi:PASTA domain